MSGILRTFEAVKTRLALCRSRNAPDERAPEECAVLVRLLQRHPSEAVVVADQNAAADEGEQGKEGVLTVEARTKVSGRAS